MHNPLGHFVASARFAVTLVEHARWELPSEQTAARAAEWRERIERQERERIAAEQERSQIDQAAADRAYAAFRQQFPKPIQQGRSRARFIEPTDGGR